MNIRAVFDRFEGNKAVLLVGEQEAGVNWPRELLPKCTEGDILSIQITVDTLATEEAKAEVDDLFEQITRQNRDSVSK